MSGALRTCTRCGETFFLHDVLNAFLGGVHPEPFKVCPDCRPNQDVPDHTPDLVEIVNRPAGRRNA